MKIDEKATRLIQAQLDSGVWCEDFSLPTLPEGAVWPPKFKTTGEAVVSQFVERCSCCGSEAEIQKVPARIQIETEGDVTLVSLDFEFELFTDSMTTTPKSVSVEFIHEEANEDH